MVCARREGGEFSSLLRGSSTIEPLRPHSTPYKLLVFQAKAHLRFAEKLGRNSAREKGEIYFFRGPPGLFGGGKNAIIPCLTNGLRRSRHSARKIVLEYYFGLSFRERQLWNIRLDVRCPDYLPPFLGF